MRLFSERAEAARPDFAVTDANAHAVAQICCRLDGVPLALELAAARVRSLSVEEVNARLDNQFRLLIGGSKTLLPRQQTLRALIDWSYDLLTVQEQMLLCRLSVFAGGWNLAAAEGACVGEGIEDWEVMDLLTALVDKSLVVYAEAGGVGRYRLLETVREYAMDRREESGARAGVRGHHRDYFLALADEANQHLTGPDQCQWISRLECECDNLREALAWSEEESGTAGAEAGLRLCVSLRLFWENRGHSTEGRQWQSRALARTEGQAPTQLRVKALYGAGVLALIQGDFEQARSLFEESLDGGRTLDDRGSVSSALNGMGLVAVDQGHYAQGRALYEESLTIKRAMNQQRGIAATLARHCSHIA